MQIRNNYQMEWEIRGRYGVVIEKGVGVFNGDTGILREINEFAETAEVEFEDGRFCNVLVQTAGGTGTCICYYNPQVSGI